MRTFLPIPNSAEPNNLAVMDMSYALTAGKYVKLFIGSHLARRALYEAD
jgi:hypothetical protein